MVKPSLAVCAVCALCLLAACTTLPQGTFCDIEHPTRLTDKTIDTMTDQEVTDALAHNLKGEKLCGWKP